MSSLTEMLKEDIKNIFLELKDFAEMHTVNFKPILVVEDNDTLAELKAGVENELSEAELLFYASVEDLPPKQGYGTFLNYDNSDWFVISWTENYGMATIALKQNGGSYGNNSTDY